MKENRKRRGGRLARRLAAILTLALALTLANVFSPYVRQWLSRLLPGVDYRVVTEQLTHEMEKAGELIAVRNTDTGIMTGTLEAKFLGTVSQVTAPYLYEIGLGVKLENVKLTPEEDGLLVFVPDAAVLYDNFQVTGAPQNRDYLNLNSQSRYQRMQDEQQRACRQGYLDDPAYMEQAWEAVCEQLEALFRQWSGENLRLTFRHV